MEVCLIKPISRQRFITHLGPSKDGRHLEDPSITDCLIYRRGKAIEIQAPPGFLVSLDGEIVENPHFTVETLPRAVRFIVPSP
jgi:diacylglycerol kinase family enzyme